MDIKKFFKAQKKFRKGGFHTNPNIGWEIIVFLAILLISGIFVFGFFLFRQTNQEFVLPTNQGNRSSVVDKDRIGRVLNYFTIREKKSMEILNTPAPVVDPSL